MPEDIAICAAWQLKCWGAVIVLAQTGTDRITSIKTTPDKQTIAVLWQESKTRTHGLTYSQSTDLYSRHHFLWKLFVKLWLIWRCIQHQKYVKEVARAWLGHHKIIQAMRGIAWTPQNMHGNSRYVTGTPQIMQGKLWGHSRETTKYATKVAGEWPGHYSRETAGRGRDNTNYARKAVGAWPGHHKLCKESSRGAARKPHNMRGVAMTPQISKEI